jgi:hypothetical protein
MPGEWSLIERESRATFAQSSAMIMMIGRD